MFSKNIKNCFFKLQSPAMENFNFNNKAIRDQFIHRNPNSELTEIEYVLVKYMYRILDSQAVVTSQ